MDFLETKPEASSGRSSVGLAGLLVGVAFSLAIFCWEAMLPWAAPSRQEAIAPIICLLVWSSIGVVYFGSKSIERPSFILFSHLGLAASIIATGILLDAKRGFDITLWSNHALPTLITKAVAWVFVALGLAVPGLLFGLIFSIMVRIESGSAENRIIFPSGFVFGLVIGSFSWKILRTNLALDLIPLVASLPAVAAGLLAYRLPMPSRVVFGYPTPKAEWVHSILEKALACFLGATLMLLWSKFFSQAIHLHHGLHFWIFAMTGLALGLYLAKESTNPRILLGHVFACVSMFLLLVYIWQPLALYLKPISIAQSEPLWLALLILLVMAFLPSFLVGKFVAKIILARRSPGRPPLPGEFAVLLASIALAIETNCFLPWGFLKYETLMLATPFLGFGVLATEIYRHRKDIALMGIFLVCILLAIMLALKAPPWDRFLASGLTKYGFYQSERLVSAHGMMPFYEESPSGISAVLRDEQRTYLLVNGKIRTSMPDDFALRLIASHLPFFFRQNPESILIVGDPGLTIAGAVASHPSEKIICVEQGKISRSTAKWFRYYNQDVSSDKRLTMRSTIPYGKFELIIIDQSAASSLFHSGLSPLFLSMILAKSAQNLVKDDGIVAYIIAFQGTNRDQLLLLISAFASIFPEKSLWLVEPSGVILLGSQKPLEIDPESLEIEFSRNQVSTSLQSIGISDPVELLGFHGLSGSEIVELKTGIGEMTIENSEILWRKYSGSPASRASSMRMLILDAKEGKDATQPIDHKKRFIEAVELTEQGEHVKAARILEELFRENPSNGYYRYFLSNYLTGIARDLRSRNRRSEALSLSRLAVEAFNTNPGAYYEASLLEDDTLLALKLLDRSISLNPDYYHAYVAKAKLQIANGDPRAALETLGSIVSAEPLNSEIGYLRAMALIESNQITSARMLLKQIMRRGNRSDEVTEALAYAFLLEGNLEKALELYRTLSKSKPKDVGILNNYATILAEQGKLKDAIKIWKQALTLDPDNMDIRANIEEAEAKIRRQ